MKKHTCPYLSLREECTHSENNIPGSKKHSICPYNNQNKCDLYISWLNKIKSLRVAENASRNALNNRMRV